MIVASFALLVGLIIGACARQVLHAWRQPALPASDTSVNVFCGTVFPAPHDPRWRLVEARDGGFSGCEVFVFGDRDIRLSSQMLSVGDWRVGGGERVARYCSDVQRCYYAFREQLALAAVEPAILNAGFGKEPERPATVACTPAATTRASGVRRIGSR